VLRNSSQNEFTLSVLDWTGLFSRGVIEIHRISVQNNRVCLRRLDLFSVPLVYVCFFALCHVDTSDCMQTVRVSANIGRSSRGQPRPGPSYGRLVEGTVDIGFLQIASLCLLWLRNILTGLNWLSVRSLVELLLWLCCVLGSTSENSSACWIISDSFKENCVREFPCNGNDI